MVRRTAKLLDRLEEIISSRLTIILLAVLFAAVAVSAWLGWEYYTHFQDAKSTVDERAARGQLGDYFGGTLNPIFGFLSVFALLVALVIQGKELRLSREELELSRNEMRKSAEALDAQNAAIEHQRFEQTFFSWLGTYRDILGSIEDARVTRANQQNVVNEYSGRRAMKFWLMHFEINVFNTVKPSVPSADISETEAKGLGAISSLRFLMTVGASAHIAKAGLQEWNSIYMENEYQLDGLFRILYRLLLWIDSQNEGVLTPPQKWLYVSIVRAQLSWIEMIYLFFNGHTQRGAKFKVLANKYALFDNLTFDAAPVAKAMKDNPPDLAGYTPSAYDSITARLSLGLPGTAEETLALASHHNASAEALNGVAL